MAAIHAVKHRLWEHGRRLVTVVCACALIASGCGVSAIDSTGASIPPPDVAGTWDIILVATVTANCGLPNADGFAVSNPIAAGTVTQDGATLSGSFDLGGATVTLGGSILAGIITITLETTGFIETLTGTANGQQISGVFTGRQPDGQGCTESGFFSISIDSPPTPDTTGLWTLQLAGTASDCINPGDDGAFDYTVVGVSVTQIGNTVTSLFFVDPSGNTQVLTGTIVGRAFVGGVSDPLNIPPLWVSSLSGSVDAAQATIMGDLAGTLAFTGGGVCVASGTFRADY